MLEGGFADYSSLNSRFFAVPEKFKRPSDRFSMNTYLASVWHRMHEAK